MASTALVQQLYALDPTGDLILILRDGFKIQASSKALSLASPYLRRQLEDAEKEFHFRDKAEHPDAVRLLVEIYHFKPPVMEKVTVPLLANVAVLVSHWDCTATLGPYKDLWVYTLWKAGNPENEQKWKEWLTIGNAFGRPDIIKEVMKNKINNGWMDWNYEEIIRYSDLAKWPEDVVDGIMDKRNAVLNRIFAMRNDFLKDLRAGCCLCVHQTPHCDALLLGSLHRKFAVKPSEYQCSVLQLLDLSADGIFVDDGHDRCTGSVIGMLTILKKNIKKKIAADAAAKEGKVEGTTIKQEPGTETSRTPLSNTAEDNKENRGPSNPTQQDITKTSGMNGNTVTPKSANGIFKTEAATPNSTASGRPGLLASKHVANRGTN